MSILDCRPGAVAERRGIRDKETDMSLPMTKTVLVGAVEYTLSSTEPGVVDARYISSGSLAADPGVICRGRAVGDTSNGFPGDYHITYFDVTGAAAAEYDWHIEEVGACYRLTWRARPESNPLPVADGGVTFEGFGFPNSERSIVVAYWMSTEVSAALEALAAGGDR
jgi:hypothetical protein